MKYTCHSGGCPGADMEWEREGEKYGVTTISYSFPGHVHEGKNPKILTTSELNEGWDHVLVADKTLKKNVQNIPSTYMKSLLCRNWFQVKNADVVLAIAKSMTPTTVEGGTGWAVQMAIDNQKLLFVFDQEQNQWMEFIWTFHVFARTFDPMLTQNFAGIGTRDLKDNGIDAIRRVYHETFTVSYNKKMEGSGFRKLSLYEGIR